MRKQALCVTSSTSRRALYAAVPSTGKTHPVCCGPLSTAVVCPASERNDRARTTAAIWAAGRRILPLPRLTTVAQSTTPRQDLPEVVPPLMVNDMWRQSGAVGKNIIVRGEVARDGRGNEHRRKRPAGCGAHEEKSRSIAQRTATMASAREALDWNWLTKRETRSRWHSLSASSFFAPCQATSVGADTGSKRSAK